MSYRISNTKSTVAKLLYNPFHAFSFGFGLGLLPKAPGTYGTLAAFPIYIVLVRFSTMTYCIVLLILLLAAIYTVSYTSKALHNHDDSRIVCDEFVAYLLVLLFTKQTAFFMLLSFVMFRFFDIVKPWPINLIDSKVEGGYGIVLDDIIAAIYSIFIIIALQSLLS